jgi:hypothetical protein
MDPGWIGALQAKAAFLSRSSNALVKGTGFEIHTEYF